MATYQRYSPVAAMGKPRRNGEARRLGGCVAVSQRRAGTANDRFESSAEVGCPGSGTLAHRTAGSGHTATPRPVRRRQGHPRQPDERDAGIHLAPVEKRRRPSGTLRLHGYDGRCGPPWPLRDRTSFPSWKRLRNWTWPPPERRLPTWCRGRCSIFPARSSY